MRDRETRSKLQSLLCTARRDQKLSCSEIAVRMGDVHEETVRRWFKGGFPTGEQLERLCGILEVDFEDVVAIIGENPIDAPPISHLGEIKTEEFSWLAKIAKKISGTQSLKLRLALQLLEAKRAGKNEPPA